MKTFKKTLFELLKIVCIFLFTNGARGGYQPLPGEIPPRPFGKRG